MLPELSFRRIRLKEKSWGVEAEAAAGETIKEKNLALEKLCWTEGKFSFQLTVQYYWLVLLGYDHPAIQSRGFFQFIVEL